MVRYYDSLFSETNRDEWIVRIASFMNGIKDMINKTTGEFVAIEDQQDGDQEDISNPNRSFGYIADIDESKLPQQSKSLSPFSRLKFL